MVMTAPIAFEGVPLGLHEGPPLSLAIAPRQTVALLSGDAGGVGPLGGYVLGLERPPAGRVTVFGTAIADLPARERLAFRRRVGYLPAGDGLIQNLSLRDNVALPLRFGSTASPREIDGRVSVILAAVRLRDAADQRPAQVTDEERRRAAFARALAFDPTALVLERPFDGLTARVAAELLELARGGETAEGARRTVLITGSELPAIVQHRVDQVYRLARNGALQLEPA